MLLKILLDRLWKIKEIQEFVHYGALGNTRAFHHVFIGWKRAAQEADALVILTA